ncbi:MAG: transglycosylase SLT domain-containing protein [Desulfobacteria bacterium]
MISKTRFLSILFLSWAMGGTLLVCVPAQADIYRYVDSNGVVHFTNAPTVAGHSYSIYIRETARTYRVNSLYDRYISAAARKHGISSSLIKAVIKAESDFNPRAVSKKGACGLMQLMPETAKDLGIVDLFDPKENIFGGTRYLKKMLTQFKELPLALAAYNAGPGKVKSRNGIPQIPETITFVRRVMKYREHY